MLRADQQVNSPHLDFTIRLRPCLTFFSFSIEQPSYGLARGDWIGTRQWSELCMYVSICCREQDQAMLGLADVFEIPVARRGANGLLGDYFEAFVVIL